MMAIDAPSRDISTRQAATLAKSTNDVLLKIIRQNFNTQFATQAPNLSRFREAVSAHGGTDVDDTILLADFWSHVPLSDYSAYKPFIDKFDLQPCMEAEVENLLAPGLPEFLTASSATTGSVSKIVPKYKHVQSLPDSRRGLLDSQGKLVAAVQYCGYSNVRKILDSSGRIVQKIPVCIATSGARRRDLEWAVDDDKKLTSMKAPHNVVPWAASVINHIPSFITIHGLFFLACRDVNHFFTLFATAAIDLFRYIDEQWDTLVSCIKDGIIPDLEGIDEVRGYLQTYFHADPERAAELLQIGPPFSVEGWASRVWPRANLMYTICSGPFAVPLPKLKSILGPNILIQPTGYAGSEGLVGVPHDMNIQDEFVLNFDEVVEFLDVSRDQTHESIRQAWQVEVGKHYEPILTVRDGLWRYQLGDIVSIVRFHSERNSPIFKYIGRRSLTIQLLHIKIADFQLLEAIMAISSENTIPVQEFTAMVDDRMSPPTVGFFVESAGSLGPNAHEAPQKLFDALAATDPELLRAFERGQIRLPTVRILKAGMFAEYRRRRCEQLGVGSGQTKVPVVMINPIARKWILEGIVQEL